MFRGIFLNGTKLAVGFLATVAWSLANSRAISEETQPAPGTQIDFSDKFFKDSSAEYRFIGDVKWQPGELTMSKGSAVVWTRNLLPRISFECHVWPKPQENSPSVTRFIFPTADGWQPTIIVIGTRQQGQALCQVYFVEVSTNPEYGGAPDKPRATELRRSPVFPVPGDLQRWSFEYNNGLIAVDCDGRRIGAAFVNSFSAWCHGVAVEQTAGSAAISQFTVTGTTAGYTPEQRKIYEQTLKLRADAESAVAQGDVFRGIEIESSRIPLMERAFGKDDYSIALVHGWIGDRWSSVNRHDESSAAHRRAADVYSKSLGANHPLTLYTQCQAGFHLAVQGKFDEADQIMLPAVQGLIEFAGPGCERTHAAVDMVAGALAYQFNDHFRKGRYEEGAACDRERLRLYGLTRKPTSFAMVGVRREAELAEMIASAVGQEKANLVEWMVISMKLYDPEVSGAPAKQYDMLRRCVDLGTECFGADNPRTIEAKLALAVCCYNTGRAGRAVELTEEAADAAKRLADKHDPVVVKALWSLGGLYSQLDRYEEAIGPLEQAAALCVEADERSTQDYAVCLLELGRHYIRIGEPAKARKTLEEALGVYAEIGEPACDNALKTRERLTDLCHAAGDLKGAETYINQQRDLVLQASGPTSIAYVDVLLSLANHAFVSSDFDAAASIYREAAQLAKRIAGKEGSQYKIAVEGLVKVKAWAGKDKDAAVHLLELARLDRLRRESLFDVYPERLQFDRELADRGMLSAIVQGAFGGLIKPDRAYTEVLAFKGGVAVRQRALRAAATSPELRQIVDDIRKLSAEISGKHTQGAEGDSAEAEALVAQREALETKLAQSSAGFRAAVELPTCEQLRALLPPDAAIVDYVQYEREGGAVERLTGKPYVASLAAFVVTRDAPTVVVPLGELEPIDSAHFKWLSAIGGEISLASLKGEKAAAEVTDAAGLTVRKLIWDPLARATQGKQNILVSPDGFLVRCPFAALPKGDGRGMMIHQKRVSVVPAPRLLVDVLGEARAEAASPDLLLVGNVDYGARGETENSEKTLPTSLQPFAQLDPEGAELAQIEDCFRQRFPQGRARQLTGTEVTEENFASAAAKSSFIHLSTHGFCLPLSELREAYALPPAAGQGDSLVAGVAVANANRGAAAGAQEDGILWTDEIASLDLSQADLVVLSACDTSLGSYLPGEGMLGCQRALQVAGAKSSLSTLWSVSVEPTDVLLAEFYDALWKRKQTKAEALQTAMLHVMWNFPQTRESTVAGRAVRCPPIYWAGFILTGDWR
jgi:CHAT domain-containing protein/tetratricopeptide (TPR) repeat protein